MKRRKFITLLGGAAAAPVLAPFTARAQQRPMRVVGYLHMSIPPEDVRRGYIQGLSEAGYVEGQNISIVYRFAEGRFDRLPAHARELVQRGVDVISTSGGSLSTQAAKTATATIPIVFMMGDADPVRAGFVASLARPGGNLTGIIPAALDSNRCP